MVNVGGMQECEALCTRIGIMVKGSLQCLGTSQHLKSKFGQGYETQVRCADGRADQVLGQFQTLFPTSTRLDQHKDFVSIRTLQLDLAQAFAWLQQRKEEGEVLDYSVSQTTLEQIFVHFAKLRVH